jgi:hypothetical protein
MLMMRSVVVMVPERVMRGADHLGCKRRGEMP